LEAACAEVRRLLEQSGLHVSKLVTNRVNQGKTAELCLADIICLVMRPAYMRYLGALGVLADCSVQVDDETRDQIIRVMEDACSHDAHLTWTQTLHRISIEARP
jgi:hypothetical protein